MPVGIKLDLATHDIIFKDGQIQIISDGEKLAQDLKTRLKINLGEARLDNKYGFPFFLVFQTKRLGLSEIESIIKQYILDTNGVESITKFFLQYSGGNERNFLVTFSVKATEEYLIDDIQVIL